MSLEAYRWAWTWQGHPDVTTAAGKVLLALADHASETNGYTCWPSLVRLAEMTGTSPTAVVRYLHQLEAVGAITRESSKGGRPRTGDHKRGTPPATSAVCTLHLTRGPNGETYPQPAPKQSQGEKVSDAKQSQGETANSLRVRPEPEIEPNHPPARVSAQRDPVRPTEGGKIPTASEDQTPGRLRPVVTAVTTQLITLDQQSGYTVRDLRAFTEHKQERVTALVLELLHTSGPWPDWLTHGDQRDLAVALTSRYRSEPVSHSIADRLDEAVRRSNPDQGPPALADTA